MAEMRRSRFETLKVRASRVFYFAVGAAFGVVGVVAAVNVSDSAADALNLVPESDLSRDQLVIGDLEDRLSDAAGAIERALELLQDREGLDDLGAGSLLDALDRLLPTPED